MHKKDIRIVFFGTPHFAAAILEHLHTNDFNIVGVVTAPDKPAGRGRSLQGSAVKLYAISEKLPVLQPEKLRDAAFLETLMSLKPDIQVVVAFRMLPELVWQLPSHGTFNLHASLLPQYRGAAPINWALINGETETGLTTFLIDHEIDKGNILLQEKLNILATDNAGTLHDRMLPVGARLVEQTVMAIAEGHIHPHQQVISGENLKPAPKIYKEDCRINFSKNGQQVVNHIRGMNPFPGAFLELTAPNADVVYMKVFDALFEASSHDRQPGSTFTDAKSFFKIAVSDGFIELLTIQLSGKKRMNVQELLRGFHMHENFTIL